MIYIITPCARPQNLLTIQKSIPKECVWVIVYDAIVNNPLFVEGAINLKSSFFAIDPSGGKGHVNKNLVLNTLVFNDDDWIYILDDDNLIHPDWYASVKPHLKANQMLKWGCLYTPTSNLPPDTPCRRHKIDTACYMIKWKTMKHLRYKKHKGKSNLE